MSKTNFIEKFNYEKLKYKISYDILSENINVLIKNGPLKDQIIVIDESRKKESHYSIKERIKRAFFIVFGSFATVSVAMLPLYFAGAGILRGFAVTTLIGISIGAIITRSAFASIMSQMSEN